MESFLSSGKNWALPSVALGWKGGGGSRNEEQAMSRPPTCPAVSVTAGPSALAGRLPGCAASESRLRLSLLPTSQACPVQSP